MALRLIFWTTLITLVLGCIWRYGDPELKQQLLNPEGQRSKPFKFDNGSHRDAALTPAPPPAPLAHKQFTPDPAPGAVRKCAKDKEVIYTNVGCPADFAIALVSGGTVNVVSGQAASLQSGNETGLQSLSQARHALHEGLDLHVDPALKARRMERAIEGGP